MVRLATYRRDYGLKDSLFGALIPAVGRLESVEIDLLSAVAIGEVKSGGTYISFNRFSAADDFRLRNSSN